MSFHNNPNYHIPELIEALKAHRLPHDTPSQLADSFRIGWMACCRELAQADSVQEDAERLLALGTAANQIFNNPPSETSQDVRDVIEWFSGSIRVVLDAARKQGANHD